MKKALITGITGQDGSYLAELLIKKGYKVYGIDRRKSTPDFSRLKEVLDNVEIIDGDLTDQESLNRAIRKCDPDEVYNLGAMSFVATSFNQPILTAEVNGLGVLKLLEAIRGHNPKIKFYQASTSEMFGKVQEVPQTEKTPFYPRSPYGVAKLYAFWIGVNYRESYDMFICNGILFNHESPRRGIEFVTRKITDALAKISLGKQEVLILGNLNSKRDWGFAGDYVEAMWLMLQAKKPDDYIIATGETHTVREFVEVAARGVGIEIEWQGEDVDEKGIDKKTGKVIIEVSKKFFRPADVELLVGNPIKAMEILGWTPKIKFTELAKMMAEEELKANKL